MAKVISIGALLSGTGTNLQAILDNCKDRKIDAEVVFVGSDNSDAMGLQRAKKYGIDTFVVDYLSVIKNYDAEKVKMPDDFDADDILAKQKLFPEDRNKDQVLKVLKARILAESILLEKMSHYSFDLLILAGFMRKLSPYFIDKINISKDKPRIMNIHPAILPSFPGVDGYGDTFRYGCKLGGCTVHFVDYGEDTGPIIGQKSFSIDPEDTLESIKKKGLKLEWELYSECIQMFAENRLKIITNEYSIKGNDINKRVIVKKI